jgi:gentisate 1,2-dioxygenase
MATQAETRTQREAYYDRISGNNLAPLWEVLHGLLPVHPQPPDRPVLWHYDEVRPALMESGRLITAKEAERRVLVLENPALRGKSRVTNSLYAGLQLLLPGEIAPTHRHSQSALRFIVEGKGAYTAVNGEKTVMWPGDFVITPSWTWHNHGNETDEPTVWLDGLDLPLLDLLNATFYEGYGEERYPFTRAEGDTLKAYGSGILPVDYHDKGTISPVLNYSYDRAREALEAMRRREELDNCHGIKMRYINPATGDSAMPTIGAFIQLLPRKFAGRPYRSTDSTVYSVVEGSGRTVIDGEAYAWREHDVFVVPSWRSHHHEANEEAVLFSFSDRPVHEKLGLWREERK